MRWIKTIGFAVLLGASVHLLVATASSSELIPLDGPYPGNQPVAIDGKIYFRAETRHSGSELWVADASGSRQLVDVVPGPDDSYPEDFVKFGGRIYFSAKDNTFGRQLWRLTDTAAERVTGGKPGESFVPQFPIVFNGALYFRGMAKDTAFAFWRFDGATLTRVGSVTVYDRPAAFNGLIYFGGFTKEHGIELYRSDGRTVDLAFDIAPGGEEQSLPSMLGEYEGWLYFSACERGGWLACTSDRLLFRTDGKTLEKVVGPKPARYSRHLTALGKLYFWEEERGEGHLCEFDGSRCRRIATVRAADTDGPVLISGSLYFVDRNPGGNSEQRNRLIRYRNGSSETISHEDLKGWSIGFLVAANGIGFLRAWDSREFRLWKIQPSP